MQRKPRLDCFGISIQIHQEKLLVKSALTEKRNGKLLYYFRPDYVLFIPFFSIPDNWLEFN